MVLVIAGALGGGKPRRETQASPGTSSSGSLRTTTSHSGSAATTARGLGTTTTARDDLVGPAAPTVAGGVVSSGAGGSGGPAACRSGPPLADVYHPNRLTVVKPCMTVSGTVESVRSEQDGDTHFDLALDRQFSDLLKAANFADQHGWLVAEVVPADEPGCTPGQPPRPASGTYDYGICTGADETTPTPGAHVYVTGPYVLDEDHGGWAEIHPVWAVSTQGSGPSASSPGSAPPTAAAPAPPTTAAASPPPSSTSGVRIESVSSPVARGSEASLVAQASPNAACDLTVTLPSGAQSQSQGLGPGAADATGRVEWTWRTGTRTTPGTATATVTCGSASASAQFQITG